MANEKSKLLLQNMPDTQILPETTYEQLTDMPQDLNEGDILIRKNGQWTNAQGETLKTRVTVGRTTTGAAGSPAQVYNRGTALEPVLDFVVPQGIQGVQGNKGEKGDTGDTGATGANGKDGVTITAITSTPKDPDPAYPNQTLTEVDVAYNNGRNEHFNVYARNGEAFGHYRGEYDTSTIAEVKKDDIFTYQGSTWIALQDQTANGDSLVKAPSEGQYWHLIAAKGENGENGLPALTVDTAVTTSNVQGSQMATVATSHFNRTPENGEIFITNDVQSDGVYIATFSVINVINSTVTAQRIQANKIGAAVDKKYQHNISCQVADKNDNLVGRFTLSIINTIGTQYNNITDLITDILNIADIYPVNGVFVQSNSLCVAYTLESYSTGNFNLNGSRVAGSYLDYNALQYNPTNHNIAELLDTVIEL